MKIRKAKVEDASEIVRFHKNTIKKINSKDYTKKIIDAWTKNIKTFKLKKRLKNNKNRIYFVAVLKNKIVGFILIDKEEKIIRALYTHHKFQRQGIGKKLLKKGEEKLKKLGVKKSKMHCSITAIPFYKSQGYKKIRWSYTKINNAKIKDLIMEKEL